MVKRHLVRAASHARWWLEERAFSEMFATHKRSTPTKPCRGKLQSYNTSTITGRLLLKDFTGSALEEPNNYLLRFCIQMTPKTRECGEFAATRLP